MIIEINTKRAGLDEEIVSRMMYRLRFALSRFDGAVSKVTARFVDVNSPKGREDKRCLISAKLRSAGKIVVKSEGLDHLEALNNCTDRLSRTLRRELRKLRYTSI